MIKASCQCGFRFTVPRAAAGALVECPCCHLYTEIIPPVDEVLLPSDIAEGLPQPSALPVYNLATHELVIPLGLKAARRRERKDFGPDPFASTRLMVTPPMSRTRAWREMFRANNQTVIAFVVLFHLVALGAAASPVVQLGYLPMFILVAAVLAHFGTVVEETSVEGRDELPRPARDLDFVADLWTPLYGMALAIAVCYLPTWLVLYFVNPSDFATYAAVSVAVAGTLVFPAVLLTTIAGGSLRNLRPDRVWGVVKVSGRRYFWLLGCWLTGQLVYTAALLVFQYEFDRMMFPWQEHYPSLLTLWPLSMSDFGYGLIDLLFSGGVIAAPVVWTIAFVWLWLGVTLMHYFCWNMGLYYREFHAAFPWVQQSQERAAKPDDSQEPTAGGGRLGGMMARVRSLGHR